MKFISSLKLTIILIIIIILLAVIGTLIPQNEEPSFYQKNYPGKAGFILALGLDHLYRSPLFLSAVFLFLLNLTACSLKNFLSKIKVYKKSNTEISPSGDQDRHLTEKLNQLRPEPDFLAGLLKQKSFRVKIQKIEDKTFITARKGLAGLFGPEIVHFGLLLIILGGLGSALFSFRTSLAVEEGEEVRLGKKNLVLKLEKFTTEFYPDGSVRDWKSQVNIFSNEGDKISAVIEVNKPVKFKGVRFYQMGYGFDWDRVRLKIKIKAGTETTVAEIIYGQKKVLDNGIELRALGFVPDFQIDKRGQVFSRSAEPSNPAALLQLEKDKQVIFSGWVFYLHPEYARFHQKKREDLEIKVESFSAPEFSVIEAVQDPASGLVWIGCLFLTMGLFGSFFFPYRELKILRESDSSYRAAGRTRKAQESFSNEIAALIQKLDNKNRRN